ncbi:MAG: PDDEXK nuclease domain-containing protein, partial [Muribaculaceae bacterium]|nr:PDDEXK nuclease domain-containing protein [Muribaculaceae bacterium]
PMDSKERIKPTFLKRQTIVAGKNYANLLKLLKEKFRTSQIKAAVKVNTGLLDFYWEMGREISQLYEKAKYGSAFFDCLSLDLKSEFPGQPGFSASNIKTIYRWYRFYSQTITNRQQLVADLGDLCIDRQERLENNSEMPSEFGLIPWGQHILIFTHSKSIPEALFYIDKTIENNWSRAELEKEIEGNLYNKHAKAVTNFDEKFPSPYSGLAKAILKSPYNFGFIDKKISSEKQLEDELARNITRFLLELGQGFAYVGRQVELRMPGGQTFIPDMIFYHTRLKCYIVCELKITEFIPDYAGKLNFYVSAVDELMRQDDDNPTIGLLICKSKDNTVVEWSFRGMSQPLGVAEYKQIGDAMEKATEILPTEAEIQQLINTYTEY